MSNKIWKTKNAELVMAVSGEIVIIVTGSRSYDDAAWDEYLRHCEEASRVASLKAAFNYSPATGPTAAQRKRFTTQLAEANARFLRIALVSNSALVRGAITATTWLTAASNQKLRAFAPADNRSGNRICIFDISLHGPAEAAR